jgi:hypothetical protein
MAYERKMMISAVAAMVLFAFSPSYAKNTKEAAPAPVPPQIAAAKKVFIANVNQDDLGAITDGPVLNGAPTRPYDEFYAAMKDWNQYELVSTPANADLIFEISWTFIDVEMPLDSKSPNPPADLGHLKVTIIDPATHVPLWGLQEHVRNAILQSNRDKNFEQAMTELVNNVKLLSSQPLAAKAASN